MNSILSWLYERACEPTTQSALSTGSLAAFGAYAAGMGWQGALVAFVGAAGGALCPERQSEINQVVSALKTALPSTEAQSAIHKDASV